MLPVPANTAGDAPSASVVVPATSANLGCAFDCAAIAVTLYLRVSATAIDSGFEIVYRGPDSGEVPRDESNLIVKAMRHCAKQAKRDLPDVRVSVENDIPFGVGLGSSAAAIIAGILLGADLCSMKLEFPAILAMALELEGHPDNIAAAVHGGMVVTAITEEPVRVLVSKAEVAQELDFIAVVPDVPLPTEKARAALPQQYSRKDVVANLQRTALLTAGFFSGRGLSPELFRDRLHQPYRAPLVPGIAECLEFRHHGLAGIFLSGAGSAVMAIARHSAAEIGDALASEFRRRNITARVLSLKADNRGAYISST